MKLNLKLEEFKKIILTIFHRIGVIVIIAIALIGGGFIGYYYNIISEKLTKNEWEKPITLKDISIAVNEKNQIMIIDKRDGHYKVYEDSVGINIFTIYVNRISNNVKK